MARILRGEIRWADLNPTRGREQSGMRPVLILKEPVKPCNYSDKDYYDGNENCHNTPPSLGLIMFDSRLRI